MLPQSYRCKQTIIRPHLGDFLLLVVEICSLWGPWSAKIRWNWNRSLDPWHFANCVQPPLLECQISIQNLRFLFLHRSLLDTSLCPCWLLTCLQSKFILKMTSNTKLIRRCHDNSIWSCIWACVKQFSCVKYKTPTNRSVLDEKWRDGIKLKIWQAISVALN